MKKSMIVLSMLLLPAWTYADSTNQREVLIGQIEAHYNNPQLMSPNSPVLRMFLQDAQSANPGVSAQDWNVVTSETAAAFRHILTQPGGPLDRMLHQALASLTDAELQRMALISADPAYTKFQNGMQQPKIQQQLMTSLSASAMQLGAQLNHILRRHGLHTVN